MTNQHPITPPPELVQQWLKERPVSELAHSYLATQAARWGADQQLKLDAEQPVGPTESDVAELFYRHVGEGSEVGFENAIAEALARWGRPKPPSLKELALDELTSAERLYPADWSTIRRALEALPND